MNLDDELNSKPEQKVVAILDTLTWHQSLTVGLIASDFRVYSPLDSRDEVLQEMDRNNWDCAGYSSRECKYAEGVIRKQDISASKEPLSALSEPIDLSTLVASECPIRDALPRIVDNGCLYVFSAKGVNKLVTRADLNKQQVRMLIYGFISSFEVRMAEWIKSTNTDQAEFWQLVEREELLTSDRLEKANEVLNRRRQKGEDTELLDCLMFIDKSNLVRKLFADTSLSKWGKKELKSLFNRMQAIRDDLAHARDANNTVSWMRIVESLETIEEMMQIRID